MMTNAPIKEKNSLIPMRLEIDEIDTAIIKLLARRFRLSTKIGKVKSLRGLAIHDSSREKQILERIDSGTFDQATKDSISTIYLEIFSRSRMTQI